MWNTDNKDLADIGGLWTERKDPITGKSSIEEHTPKLVQEWCPPDKHYFVMDDPRSRIIVCKHCKYEAKFVLGMQKLVDGKIVELVRPK